MDIFKNLIDKRRRTIVEDEARSQLLTLGEEFLSSVSVKDICKFLVKFGIAHEDDLAKAPEEEIRALLKEWLAPPVEEALVDADGKSSSASETSSGKTSDDPLNLVLEKLEYFSSRLLWRVAISLIRLMRPAVGSISFPRTPSARCRSPVFM